MNYAFMTLRLQLPILLGEIDGYALRANWEKVYLLRKSVFKMTNFTGAQTPTAGVNWKCEIFAATFFSF